MERKEHNTEIRRKQIIDKLNQLKKEDLDPHLKVIKDFESLSTEVLESFEELDLVWRSLGIENWMEVIKDPKQKNTIKTAIQELSKNPEEKTSTLELVNRLAAKYSAIKQKFSDMENDNYHLLAMMLSKLYSLQMGLQLY